jgi:hypothetical protein
VGAGPWPTLLVRLPNGKDRPSLFTHGTSPNVFALVQAGYAVVFQDCRGSFRSDGPLNRDDSSFVNAPRCLTLITAGVYVEVVAVPEGRLTGKQFLHLGPPITLLGVSLFSLAASCDSNRTRTMSRLSSVMPLVEPSPLVGGRAEIGHPPFDNGSNSGQLKIDRTQTAIDLAATLSNPGRRRTPRQTITPDRPAAVDGRERPPADRWPARQPEDRGPDRTGRFVGHRPTSGG